MNEHAEQREEYAPLSPPQPPYMRSPDQDLRDGISLQRPRVPNYNNRPQPSQASIRSWVSSLAQNPPPPPEPINVPPPVPAAGGLSGYRSRPPTGFGADEEFMNIDPHGVAGERENGYGWTTNGYPHPMEVVPPRPLENGEPEIPQSGRKEKKGGGFVGGFFTGLLRRRGPKGGKLEKKKQMRQGTLGTDASDNINNLALRSGTTLPLYTSNPTTPVAARAPTNIEYTSPVEMPIPEVVEPPPSEPQRQSMISQGPTIRRPSLRISVIAPSDGQPLPPSQVHSDISQNPPASRHASTIRQDSVQRSERSQRAQSERDTIQRQGTQQGTQQGSPRSPDAVLPDIQPTRDYRKMRRPPETSSTYSRINQVQNFFRTLSRLPWMKHDRITTDYEPENAWRARARTRAASREKEHIVVLDKPPTRWYYEESPAHHSVDLLSNGEASASSAHSRSSRTRSTGSARSPRRSHSVDGLRESSTLRYRNQHTPPYESPRRQNVRVQRSPPLSPTSPQRPARHHSQSPSLSLSPPPQPHQHPYGPPNSPPRRRRRHHHHHSSHRHYHDGNDPHQAPPPLPPHPQSQPQPFAMPAAIYAPTYIPYGHPSFPLTPHIFTPPQQQPLIVVQSQTGSGSGTPIPTAVRLNTPEPNQLLQQSQPTHENQQHPHQQQSPLGQQGQGMHAHLSPLYIPSSLMPGIVLSDGRVPTSPTGPIPGQYTNGPSRPAG